MYASGEDIIRAYNAYQQCIDLQTGSFTSEAYIFFNPLVNRKELIVYLNPYRENTINFTVAFDDFEDEVEACAGCGSVNTDNGQCSVCCDVTFSPGSYRCVSCDLFDECMNHIMSL